jgi:uncharacterized membrane protein YbhN (UPF0104 family)
VAAAPKTPLGSVADVSSSRRLLRVGIWLGSLAVGFFVLDLLGIDLSSWFASLWDALTAVDVEYLIVGLVFQTLETLFSGIAWVAILRAAYPSADVRVMPVITCYAVGVAGNAVLPANLGTLITMLMFIAVIQGATFVGIVGAQVVHKIFFVFAGLFVYLYLFLSVPGSFELELGFITSRPVVTLLVAVGVVLGIVALVRVFWKRLVDLWQQGKRGGVILADWRAYLLKVVLPELGAWLSKLAVIGIFLAAYGIPATFHTIMTVAGGNSLANVVSVTPGGIGVNQAVNSATLTREGVDRATALAYSTGQQLVTTAWNIGVAIVLVAVVFGWAGGRGLVMTSYDQAKAKASDLKSGRKKRRSLRRRRR